MKLIILLVFSLAGLVCYVNDDNNTTLDGIYYDKYYQKSMEIKSDILIIRSNYAGKPEMMAVCHLQQRSATFWEINSIEGSGIINSKDMSIIRENNQNSNCCTEITFKVPNINSKLLFDVHCGRTSYSGHTDENGICTIMLDKEHTSFHFTLYPEYYVESNVKSQYLGIMYYRYPYPYEIYCKMGENIIVELPKITDMTFTQYYLTGEYIEILPSGIRWRGETYRKQRNDKINYAYPMIKKIFRL